MAIVTTSVLTSCSVRPEEKESRAADALAKKYNREFEVTRVYPQKFGDPYYEVQAYPVDEPQVRFSASIDTEDDNISDTYVERRVCAAIARQAEENLDGLPGYYYLFARAMGPQPITDDAEIAIEDYAALDPYNQFRIEAFVVPEKKDADAFYGSMAKIFKELEYLDADVRLFVVDEEQMDSVQVFFEEHDEITLDFLTLTENFFSVKISYKDGKIEMDRDVFVNMTGEVL